MKALRIKDKRLSLREIRRPEPTEHEALVRIKLAGICATDVEIVRGYMDFHGTLGHEFVGVVEDCDSDPGLIGKRVVGEITAGCGHCSWCQRGLSRHCPERDTLGIQGRDGVFAEYAVLPAWNLREVPPEINDRAAVFTEPLAAACEILEQVHLQPGTSVLLIGDGKFAHLAARLLSRMLCRVEVVGRSEAKVRRMKGFIERGYLNTQPPGRRYPVVIEASGSPQGWETAVSAIEPRGTLILKSTYAAKLEFNPAPLVINEINLIGSRCGRFEASLKALAQGLPVVDLIDGEFPLEQWREAFETTLKPDVVKVLFNMEAK